ncbi:MAG TPA: hypothetical protein VF704_08000 [Allosphingosinicella sp.]
MYVVEIFLPLSDNDGRAFPAEQWQWVRETLVERFAGLTAFSRSPAEGLWEAEEGRSHDEIVILEVMAEALDRDWWRGFRDELERRFRQQEVVVRARRSERL